MDRHRSSCRDYFSEASSSAAASFRSSHDDEDYGIRSSQETSYPLTALSLSTPRVGLENLDLNSQAEGFPHINLYSKVLRSEEGHGDPRLPLFATSKFYPVDSEYPNRPDYLAPYRGTEYHLPEYREGPMPRGKKELFNFAHSSLCNVIEQSFGVLKMKWRILLNLPSYPMEKQSKIIMACMALHNFIRGSALAVEEFDRCDRDENYMPMVEENRHRRRPTHQADEDEQMNRFREWIGNGLLSRS